MAVFLTLVLVVLPASAEEQQSSKQKVAVVNSVVITQEQFSKELKVHLERLSRQGRQISDDQLGNLKKEILEGLIEREVLYQQTQKEGIQISDQKINGQLETIKERFPSEDEYMKAIESMGLTEDEIKTQIGRGLAIRELIDQQVAVKIVVTDKESKEYYDDHPQMFKQPERVKASHILIKAEANVSDAQKVEARKKISEIQQKLKDGGDFATLAKEYSEGPSNVRGGDLGYFRRGQMVKPFEDAAFAMQPNEVSDVVETRFGYHLIKVYDKKPEQVLAYADVKEKLAQRLKQQKVEKEASQYVDKLKRDAKIEKFI
jgi:peptidyl-prolyl cis-trans isomerase C